MISSKSWRIGLLLVVVFSCLAEMVAVFGAYTDARFGLDRDFILMMLWAVPAVASFLAGYYAPKRNALSGLSYIPILSVLGPLAHFLVGQLGIPIDFGGFDGLKFTFQIYFVGSVVTVSTGAVVALLLRRVGRFKHSPDA